MKKGKIKVLLAKPQLDEHWTGPFLVASALRDAGMEVIYLDGPGPEGIVQAAIAEDVDVIGLSLGYTSYGTTQRITELLHEKGIEGMLLVAGGQIPREDIPEMKKSGISEVFPPGSSLKRIVAYIQEHVPQRV